MSEVSISDHAVTFGGKDFTLRYDMAALQLVDRYAKIPYAAALEQVQVLDNTFAVFAAGTLPLGKMKPADVVALVPNVKEHARMCEEILAAFRKSQPETFAEDKKGEEPSPLA